MIIPDIEKLPKTLLKYIQYLKDSVVKYKFDNLTELPMRGDFNDTLDTYSLSGYPFILYLIDLNGLKYINDNKSYEHGDIYILDAVKELKKFNGRLYRIGGDEFAIITYKDSRNSVISTEEYCVGRSEFEDSKSAKEYFKSAEAMLKKEKLKFYQESGLCRRK